MHHGIRLAPLLTLLMLLHGAAPAFALGGEAAVAKVKLSFIVRVARRERCCAGTGYDPAIPYQINYAMWIPVG